MIQTHERQSLLTCLLRSHVVKTGAHHFAAVKGAALHYTRKKIHHKQMLERETEKATEVVTARGGATPKSPPQCTWERRIILGQCGRSAEGRPTGRAQQ